MYRHFEVIWLNHRGDLIVREIEPGAPFEGDYRPEQRYRTTAYDEQDAVEKFHAWRRYLNWKF